MLVGPAGPLPTSGSLKPGDGAAGDQGHGNDKHSSHFVGFPLLSNSNTINIIGLIIVNGIYTYKHGDVGDVDEISFLQWVGQVLAPSENVYFDQFLFLNNQPLHRADWRTLADIDYYYYCYSIYRS